MNKSVIKSLFYVTLILRWEVSCDQLGYRFWKHHVPHIDT